MEFLWLAAAAAGVTAIEFVYRYSGWPWLTVMLRCSPLIVLVQSGLYFGYRADRAQVLTWGLYTVLAASARLCVAGSMGELTRGHLIGTGVMVLGAALMKFLR